MSIEFENENVRYVIGSDARNRHFIDKGTGRDYCAQIPSAPCAYVIKAGREYPASTASVAEGGLVLQFEELKISATIKVTPEKHYFTVEVLSISDEKIDEFVFSNLPLTLAGKPGEPFAGCALALNLTTKVTEMPGLNSHIRARCYQRFGFTGAKVAIIGCPQSDFLGVMKEVVSAAEDLPHSPLGGPWALDEAVNRGS